MQELRVDAGPLEAVLLPEAGARLHRLRAFGHELLRTPDDPEEHLRDPFFWGGYLMAPWCNRLAPGATTVSGRTVNLSSNFADGSAIHGQVASRPWTVMPDGSCAVRGGGDGWPWPYDVTLSATATGGSLHLAWRLTNLADEPMPAGIGFHPWWLRPVQLRTNARSVYASNTTPTDEPEPVSGALDLRALSEPTDGLDGTWTWTDGSTARATLSWPELGLQATMKATPDVRYVAVATPSSLDAIAVEPQTHAPDGLRRFLDGRTDGLVLLQAGGSLPLDIQITVTRA